MPTRQGLLVVLAERQRIWPLRLVEGAPPKVRSSPNRGSAAFLSGDGAYPPDFRRMLRRPRRVFRATITRIARDTLWLAGRGAYGAVGAGSAAGRYISRRKRSKSVAAEAVAVESCACRSV